MITNNTIVAVAIAAGLVGFATLLRHIVRRESFSSEGFAGLFATTGLISFAVGLHTTLTWPYGFEETAYGNIAFGEPAVGFGALLLFAAVYLWRHRTLTTEAGETASETMITGLRPVSIFVFFLGAGTAFIALAWVRFQMGAAPPQEPVSGNFGQWPMFEAVFLFLLWGSVALGAMLFPLALRRPRGKVMSLVIWLWLVAGVVLGLFGALNFYTHIGMNYNLAHDTMHRW